MSRTIGEIVDALVSKSKYNNYAEIRLTVSEQFIEMMKFTFPEKYKLIEDKEIEFQRMVKIINELRS
tara:strand:+ start:46 stop:246 length:201 start_codon:yes stop_codon:yes gene_type:complete